LLSVTLVNFVKKFRDREQGQGACAKIDFNALAFVAELGIKNIPRDIPLDCFGNALPAGARLKVTRFGFDFLSMSVNLTVGLVAVAAGYLGIFE
jgi:hypothetical protein